MKWNMYVHVCVWKERERERRDREEKDRHTYGTKEREREDYMIWRFSALFSKSRCGSQSPILFS